MADLSVDDRGQILLVTAFILAASFVALAVILNSAIYTENLATREESAKGTDAVGYRADMVRGTEHLIEYSNENKSGKSDIRAELAEAIEATSNRTAQQDVLDGQLVNASLYGVTWGTKIAQNDTSGNFTNATQPATAPVRHDWTVATGVESTRSFRINVTSSDQLDTGSDPLTFVVDDGTDTWEMEIYRQGSPHETVVNVVGDGDCIRQQDPTIGVTAGTFNGTDCGALTYGDDVDSPYDIRIKNGDNVEGTFSMVVKPDGTTNENTTSAPSDSDPFAAHAVYSAKIHVRYESQNLIYETDARAIPGESDD